MSDRMVMPPVFRDKPPGVLTLAFEENYYPRLLHATMQQRPLRRYPRRIEHKHDVYHIVLVTGGSGTFLRDGHLLPTRRGDLHLINPGQRHSFEVGSKETTEYCEITMQFVNRKGKALILPLREVIERWSGLPCSSPDEIRQVSAELYALIVRETGQIVQACQSPAADAQWRICRSLGQLFQGLLLHWFRANTLEAPDSPLEPAYRHIQAHYTEPISLADLARLSHLSENYLSRAFKARYGVTPIYHQHRLRVQAAKVMLQTTHYPLKKIAEITGFCDEHYLSRIFRRHEFIPPNRYRQQCQTR